MPSRSVGGSTPNLPIPMNISFDTREFVSCSISFSCYDRKNRLRVFSVDAQKCVSFSNAKARKIDGRCSSAKVVHLVRHFSRVNSPRLSGRTVVEFVYEVF